MQIIYTSEFDYSLDGKTGFIRSPGDDTAGKRAYVETAENNLKLIAAAFNVIWKLNRKTDQGWAKIDINDAVIRELKTALGAD